MTDPVDQLEGTPVGQTPAARLAAYVRGGGVVVPVLTALLAFVIGGLVVLITGHDPIATYKAIFEGTGFQWLFPWVTGSDRTTAALNLQQTLILTTPLILTGLAVAFAFRAGLFNIGGQGQFLLGATAAAGVGAALATAPAPIAITAALVAGMLAGAAWGWIPGALKAFSGAHEVVTTIMLNSIAAALIGFLILGPLLAPGFSFGRTGDLGNSALPIILGSNIHLGVPLAIAAVPVVWWLLYRSTLGFEIRSVGANPSAARYAGMRPAFLIMFTMSMSGLLFGIAGSTEILGVSHFMIPSYGTAIGFDAIAVALLGRSHPFGIAAAALLFGALRAGAGLMQVVAEIPVEIVDVIQAIILLFLAADVVVRRLFRIRAAGGIADLKTVTSSYAGRAR